MQELNAKLTAIQQEIIDGMETLESSKAVYEFKKVSPQDTGRYPHALEGIERKICVAAPIIISGDVGGAVVMVASDTLAKASESDEKLVRVAAAFLGKQMEE